LDEIVHLFSNYLRCEDDSGDKLVGGQVLNIKVTVTFDVKMDLVGKQLSRRESKVINLIVISIVRSSDARDWDVLQVFCEERNLRLKIRIASRRSNNSSIIPSSL